MPPIEPAMPPMPTIVPTSFFAKMSDTVVKRFADHAWCAAPARPMSRTAGQSPTLVAPRMGRTHRA